MKGLLHRLAERAAGTAASLRPDARLPYVAAPPVIVPVGDDHLAPADVGGLATRAAAGPSLTRPERPAGRTPPAVAMGAGQPVFTDAAAAALGPKPHQHEGRPVMPTSVPALLMRLPLPVPAPDTLPGAVTWAPSPHAPGPVGAAGRNPLSWAEPARLVAPDTRAEVPPKASLRPSASPVQATAEPTEVHVHIGRIEVTAVHEPPAPRRPTPPRAAPVSLQAYLATKGKA